MFELVVIPILVSVLLTKWGIVSFVNSVRAFFQQLLGLCCRKRVAVTEADVQAASEAAAAAAAGSEAGSPLASPRASPRADEAPSPSEGKKGL